ncbi:MAG: N-acetyl sugar amidotransferase [Candidatus Omnitrophota bacterium]
MTKTINGTEVLYCTKCVISNQRPRITFDEKGVCSACQHAERKKEYTDWAKRKDELCELLDKYRRKDGSYDVVVPCSGGKDSAYIAHQLKHKYGMHPLTVTFSPHIYTDIGKQNYDNFIKSGFDNIFMNPDGKIHRQVTRLAFEKMGDPFQPFIYGVKAFPLHIAVKYRIPLVMYAEDGEVEYGGETRNADKSTINVSNDMTPTYFSGFAPEYWTKYGMKLSDLQCYMLPDQAELEKVKVDYRYFAYYTKWIPQENYYYACKYTGFRPNLTRSEGTYSKYASLDDRLDGIHYYLAFIKFGIGRATSDAAHEIRDGHLTREEGVALVKKYDGEFPKKHFKECLEYMDITEEHFWKVIDGFRLPHIWKKQKDEWKLKQQVS